MRTFRVDSREEMRKLNSLPCALNPYAPAAAPHGWSRELMIEGHVWAVTCAGRAAFSEADAPAVRTKLQAELTAEKRPLNLKNADDQSVAGLLAVRDACRRQGSAAPSMQEWGVLAAPRTPGRSTLIASLTRY